MPSIPNSGTAPSRAWPILYASTAQQHYEYQQHRHAAFQALRPITTQLLLFRDQAERLQPQLVALRNLLCELLPDGVEGCWDYVAFPLMILIDAVVPSRVAARPARSADSGGSGSSDDASYSGGGTRTGDLVAAACRSDRVVEALLGALLALLERTSAAVAAAVAPGRGDGGGPGRADGGVLRSAGLAADRSVAALQHLAPLLQLGREEASEEVHIALQRCVAKALAPLASAAAEAAVTPSSGGGGGGGGGGAAAGGIRGSGGDGGAYSVAVLCGEELAPLAGYLLHSCLEVSEREILAGHRGSKALCTAALTSLGALLAALPHPDVLAFFLPGVVSGLSKHLYAAGSAAAFSGPSAPPGASATVQALACLRTAMTTVLSDESTASILVPTTFAGSSGGTATAAVVAAGTLPNVRSADEALSALKQLSLSSSIAAGASKTGGAAAAAGAAPPSTPAAADLAAAQPRPRRLQVDRSLGWLEDTACRVNSLLGRALPPLCSHTRPAVRAELATTLMQLLERCGHALAASQPVLLRLMFTLAQDEWQQVAAPCQAWIARQAPPIAGAAAPVATLAAIPANREPVVEATLKSRETGANAAAVDGVEGCGGSSGAAAGSQHREELKELEDEFQRFMQGLMSDSALTEQPALDLDEHELFGGPDEGAGGRDQSARLPIPPSVPARNGDGNAPPGLLAISAAPSPPPPPPPPPALPGLQSLIAESATSAYLWRAVTAGEAEAVVQARCLTTALLVAGSDRVAKWLLLRPAALTDLLLGLFRCFAFDRNAATLILHLRGEAGSYAPSVVLAIPTRSVVAAAPAQGTSGMTAMGMAETGTGAKHAAGAALAGGAIAAAELPRMPLGLLYLASQRSYSGLAAVARSLGRLARAADLEAAAAAAPLGHGIMSSVLRRLVDELGTEMRRVVARGSAAAATGAAQRDSSSPLGAPEGNGEDNDDGDGSGVAVATSAALEGPGGQSWQCEAAAIAAVTAEVIIGASNAWAPPLGAPPQCRRGDADGGEAHVEKAPLPPPFPAADPAFESILLGLLQDLMRPAIIKLPTHNEASGAAGRRLAGASATAATAGAAQLSYNEVVRPDLVILRGPLTAQVLGENVMLLRAVLEVVGTAARAAGPRFVAQGRLLRAVLVPLLELLGDPSPPVAAAADTALQSICVHCGYGGSLTALLGANADYVVDSLCARLRDLQRHPRAPHLLAALLRRAGVAPQLLPLMAEPLQRTLQGLSALSRNWAPNYVHSYLAVLRELAAGAAGEAAAGGEVSRREVAELNRLAAEARDRELVEEAAPETVAGWDATGPEVAPEAARRHEDVRQFFMKHNAAAGGGGSDEDAAGKGRQRRLLTLTAGQLEDNELRFRRLHAVAVVAGAATDAATPLLVSSDLRAAVMASDVLRGALAALAAVTPAVEAEAAVVEEYGGAEARMRPVRPETPKVLPAVAVAWSPLMAALRDSRTPVVERGVVALAELVALAGGAFLARRFQQEAWPVLQRLLTHGSAHTPGLISLGTDAARRVPRRRLEIGNFGVTPSTMLSGGEDVAAAPAPAAVTRVRVATLRCLEAVCRCRDAGVTVRTLTWSIAQASLPFLGSSHPPPLYEAAQGTLLAVSALDPDGVWLLLYDTSYNMPPSPTPARGTGRPPPGGTASMPDASESPGSEFPLLRLLLPPLPRVATDRLAGGGARSTQQSQWPVTAGMAAECGPRALSLLTAVVVLEAPWHATRIPDLDITVD